MQLAPGDVFALLSDGIYEYQNAAAEQFGEDGVAGVLRAHAGAPMAEVLDALLAAVQAPATEAECAAVLGANAATLYRL